MINSTALWMVAASTLGIVPGSAADELKLRTDCGGVQPPECFEELAPLLAELHAPSPGRAVPGPTNPVVVDIGPGVFALDDTTYPYCDGLSHLTVRGTGKYTTVLTGGGYPAQPGFYDVFGPYAVLLRDCSSLEFQHLGIATQDGVSRSAIRFTGAGGSSWTDVRIEAVASSEAYPVAWLDSGSSTANQQEHSWNSVEVEVAGSQASGFWVVGSEHYFSASAIEVHAPGLAPYGAILGTGQFELTVEGSRLEVHAEGGSGVTRAFLMSNGAGFFPNCSQARVSIAGSRIQATTAGQQVFLLGLQNECTGFQGSLRVRGSIFTLEGVGGGRRRLGGAGIDSPYSLGSGANPPASVLSNWSLKGQDTFLETDCSATLCADGPVGGATHLLSFDPACAAGGPWFDTATGRCRGQ